uniref:Chemokine interleukin-8-like domain-containing protein n=1 Tax=Poecilia reticulata TaxID=8081 RepID=A0A3P9QHF6_POERE
KKTRILAIKSHYPTGKNRPCCLHVSRKNLSRQVAGSVFHKQPARFPCVNAVIFYTKKGPICVHPNNSWVQQGMSSSNANTGNNAAFIN